MSVLVDTNVVSELIGRSPDPAVGDWAATHDLDLANCDKMRGG